MLSTYQELLKKKKKSLANQKAAWSDGISDTVLLLGEVERLKAEGIRCTCFQSVQQACEESMLWPGGENSLTSRSFGFDGRNRLAKTMIM